MFVSLRFRDTLLSVLAQFYHQQWLTLHGFLVARDSKYLIFSRVYGELIAEWLRFC